MKKIFFSFLFIPLFIFAFSQSQNYKIQFESINIGGLDVQTSTLYKLKESIGEVATGLSESSLYKLFAGYRQMDEVSISISVTPTTINMTPPIGGLTGGVSNGSTTVNVMTDNLSGYQLQIKATSSPALKCKSSCNPATDYFSDYTPQNAGVPDFLWQVSPDTSEFGFTPEGQDIVQKFKDNGATCNTGTLDTQDRCWYNLSMNNQTISQSFANNQPSGTQTIVKFRAESGPNHIQPSGIYEATIIFTAFTQ